MITLLLLFVSVSIFNFRLANEAAKQEREKIGKHRIFHVVHNKVKCNTMRYNAMYDFLLSLPPCNYRATVLFVFILLAELNRRRRRKEQANIISVKDKCFWQKPFDCWRIWQKNNNSVDVDMKMFGVPFVTPKFT